MSQAASRRFGWVNGFMAASLHAVLGGMGLEPKPGTTFRDVNAHYLEGVRERTLDEEDFPRPHLSHQDELSYLFHLEAELWGADHATYEVYFPAGPHDGVFLQTHLLPQAFFLLERWLYFFLRPSERKASRRSRRRAIFGERDGLLTVKHPACLAALGPPFHLLGAPSKVVSMSGGEPGWDRARSANMRPALARFYRATCGHEHFADVLAASFVRTRRKLPSHLLNARQRRKPSFTRGLRATWYDVLWLYSESFRYHDLAPQPESMKAPFHWNRSVRWCVSLLISGLMEFAARGAGDGWVDDVWHAARRRNQALERVMGISREAEARAPSAR